MSNDSLIITDQISINASEEKVWEVLTNPEYIKLWDEIPDNYQGGNLMLGSEINWEGYSKLVVTGIEDKKWLKLNLLLPNIDIDPKNYDVSYQYKLMKTGNSTLLEFEIGNFAPLPNGELYYSTSASWLTDAKEVIKKLAEN